MSRSPRARKNLQAYTNIDGAMTYDEIGKILGLSKEAVRKIEKKAIEKLKRFENRLTWQEIKESMGMLSAPKNHTLTGARL